MPEVVTIQESFELIRFLNTLNDYTKRTMPDDNLLIIREGNVYVINKEEPLFAIRGELSLDVAKLPVFSNWIKDKTVTIKNRELFELKKDTIKKNIHEGYADDDRFVINYLSKATEIDTLFIIEHAESIRITKIVDKINDSFDQELLEIHSDIKMNFEEYKEHDGASIYFKKENDINIISFDEFDELLISVPSKYLLKMKNGDTAKFDIFKKREIENTDFSIVIFTLTHPHFKLEQLFVTI